MAVLLNVRINEFLNIQKEVIINNLIEHFRNSLSFVIIKMFTLLLFIIEEST